MVKHQIEDVHFDSYRKLKKYVHLLQMFNPETIVKIQSEPIINEGDAMIFKRVWVMFKAIKFEFLNGCRPFIGLDVCHLK